MAGELKVDPSDLDAKAAMIESIPWGADPAAVRPADPDKLTATTASVRNLVKNAEALGAEQQWGIAESRRLAETLRLVGQAYQQVDEASRNNIDATIPGGSSAPAAAPVPIGNNSTPAPPAPPAMAPFENVPTDGEMLDPIETDNKLLDGDQAAALRAAAAEWTANAARLTEASLPFEIRIENWEGVAAEAAYTKFKSFGGWLQALAGKWTQLAAEAEKLATAHDQAKAANAPVRAEYEALQAEVLSGGGLAASQAKRDRMMQLYQESEAIRETYANGGRPTPIQPPQPRPDAVAPTSPVTGNGDPNARGVPAKTEDEERRGGSSDGAADPQGSGAGGQGQSQGPGQPQMPQEAPVSPASATDPAAQAAQQAGQQGGSQGGPQGGAPGGGAPSGGSPGAAPGGMPTTGKGTEPRLPTDPSLKPAATGGGSGAGGGGGGGGVPSSPLQPAVGAETVAPTPIAPGAPIPMASSGSGGGAMGGGMGGMAPMHGGQAGGGAGEKKRNPQLSPDEPLYVEDRPHTEQVIGVRPRRRGAPDDGKKGETQ